MKRSPLALLGLALLCATHGKAQETLYPQHFPLHEVELLDGPMKTAMLTNARLLLQYDADRLMAPFIRQAGLDQQTGTYHGWLNSHPSFTNWGLKDWSLEGHVGGHYLTALSLAIAALPPAEQDLRSLLVGRLDYCLNILKDCQDAFADHTDGMKGFIGGQPINQIWTGLYSGNLAPFKQYGGWVPLYCEHKVLAGLRDAYVYAGSEQAKELFRGLADWSVALVSHLSTDQMQVVLGWEHGGVNETLADAYALFHEQKYLDAAHKYCHQTMVDGMQTGYAKNFLDNKHANTQVPKYIGFERIAQLDGTPALATAARNFWADVQGERTVCIGGNSVDEHFLAKGNAQRYIDNLNGPESCNTNNMLKLSEDLFDDTHDTRYADFYEAAMYNHILSTQDPETGGYVYFTTLRPQGYRIYSQVNQGMWCCVGTGMENHSKYGHFIYTHSGDTLYVNLFTASRLSDDRFALTQTTQFPYEPHTRLTIDKGGTYTIAVRRPSWAGDGYKVMFNGAETGTTITATFSKGDVIDIDLPMTLRYEECPGLTDYIAFKYGPILLGARTTHGETLPNEYGGEGRMDHAPGSRATALSLTTSPLLICQRDTLLRLIRPLNADSMTFTLTAPAAVPNASQNYFATHPTMTLEPFYAIHHDRYMCYWYQATPEAYAHSSMAAEEQAKAQLDLRTLDYVGTGEQQSEAGHEAAHSSDSNTGSYNGEFYRDAKANGYMEYVLTIPDTTASRLTPDNCDLALMLRFTVADKGRQATATVNGQKLADITIPASVKGQDSKGFYYAEYKIPAEAIFKADGTVNQRITFRLTASASTLCPGLYFLRLVGGWDDGSYRFVAREWKTGDAGRVSQSNFSYDDDANNLTVNCGTGANNLCLMLDYAATDYQLDAGQRYLTVRGTDIKTTSGASYLWWLNGVNHGSQVAPTLTRTLPTGDVVVAWDMTTSGLDANNTAPRFSICQGQTIFGMTSTTGTSTIKDVSFQSDLDAYCTTATNLATVTPRHTAPVAYDLAGRRVPNTSRRGLYIIGNKVTAKE